jgi:leucyl aminopeptidase
MTRAANLPVRAMDLAAVPGLDDDAARRIGVVGVPVLEGDAGPVLGAGVPDLVPVGRYQVATSMPPELVSRRGFTGKARQHLERVTGDGPATVHLGCGPASSFSAESLRQAAAALVGVAGRSGEAMFVLPAELAALLPAAPAGRPPLAPAGQRAAQAVAEGAVLGSYRFGAHKTSAPEPGLGGLVVVGAGIAPEDLAEGVRRGAAVASAVCFARDLANEPPSTMTPRALAAAVEARLGAVPGVTLEVWDEQRIEAERLGGLMAVARGSVEPPRLLWASFEPSDPRRVDGRVPHVVLVGKGITFDSGGLSLKPADAMMAMKTDMSGAAAVLATLGACHDLGVRVKVTAIAPVTENMPGGRAQKPGDVFTARNGKTVEVLNTDAEGRLVLADGLSLASELGPDVIVDLATLTGACVVALGGSIAGLFGNDASLVERLGEAGAAAGERTWLLPLAEEYAPHIESEVADMKNIGKPGQAGAIVAALVLQRFVDGVPWAHLDIAGPSRSEDADGVLAKGATGFGVRTLLEFLDRYGADPLPLRPTGDAAPAG